MSVRYRRLSPEKDYTFGQNDKDFISDLEAVKQAVYTRLKLLYSEWWEDVEDGFPFFEQIAGRPGSQNNIAAADLVIRERILGTTDVSQIAEYSSSFNSTTRRLIVYTKVNTIYGEFSLEVTF